ncbi:MAG: HAMP domain-containing sensor histidine kinase [Chthoniobacterales bacterium]
MPGPISPAQTVLENLGFVLFARASAGTFELLGEAPPWLRALWPALAAGDRSLPVAEASPFLENFLIDAEECWGKGDAEQAKSGPWIEQDAKGGEVQIEATALTAAGQAILLFERLGEAFEAKKSVLQRARETVIAHQRLNSEIQKKEILLHCVADEMTAALANAITSLRLIELEDNGPRTKMLLGLATRATEEQQTLIHRILGVFEDELRGVFGNFSLTTATADWDSVLKRVLESAGPLFAEKAVRFDLPTTAARAVQIGSDAGQVERAVGNLLENAVERSPAGGVVVLRSTEEPETLLIEVDDDGPPLPPETCADRFARMDPAQTASSAELLRLHFCRIVAENCGGEIGCAARPGGGNRCWLRLTKASAK